MTTWSVGEVVNTLGSHPSIQGFEPPTDYHFFMRIKKRKQSFLFKNVYLYKKNGWGNWIRTSEMADSESAALPLGYTPKDSYYSTEKLVGCQHFFKLFSKKATGNTDC